MGLLDILSPITNLLGLEAGAEAGAEAQVQSAGYQYQANVAEIKSKEKLAKKTLKLDRDKFEFLKEQAKVTPASQTGSYGYPYVAVKQYEAAPLVTMPIIVIGGLLFYFVRRKRR